MREPNGNFVLRSGNGFDMRFFPRYGGTPLEMYSKGMMISNPFAGAGTSLAFNTGQDPTQASANGIAENPICCFDMPETQKYNYYAREIEANDTTYHVNGFAPDFWLSHEPADDYIADGVDVTGFHGWRTMYRPDSVWRNEPDCPVVFVSNGSTPRGYFFPRNEMDPTRPRSYGKRRVAAKVTISLAAAKGAHDCAGICWGLNKCETVESIESGDGLWLVFSRQGEWKLIRRIRGGKKLLISGRLPSPVAGKIRSRGGLQIEIRTKNYDLGFVDLIVDGEQYITLPVGEHTCLHPYFALYAKCTHGHVRFGNRQVFHVGTEFSSKYSVIGHGRIRSEMTVRSVVDEPITFYRGNLPGIFMNPNTFPIGNRGCWGMREGYGWEKVSGIHPIDSDVSYFAGNSNATLGLRCSNMMALIDGDPSPEAHILIEAHPEQATNFVMMLNPLKPGAAQRCFSIALMATWSDEISTNRTAL